MTALDQLPTIYEPQSVETDIRRMWEDAGYFRADPANPNEPYTIVIPPPNVTGALHGGHALNNTLQDILIRWHRMRGFNTLWMPGTDHAGIATQAVVERTIFEQEKKTRHELGREELVKRIWDWKEQYGNRIISQLQLMGCSCDWDRTRFTLDEVCARAVRHTFFKLFKDGLIVRGKRLVNWDTHLQTAVADDEVYHEQVKGHFYHFQYPVIDPKPGEPKFVHIATTRPETMLGDTAVAVHPDPAAALDKVESDLKTELAGAPAKEKPAIEEQLAALAERREKMLPTLLKLRDMANDGRKLNLPLVDRKIPLIADIWAKPELGSGCVKITPAHDVNDYDVGLRHKLPIVNVMTPDGHVAQIVEPDGSVNPNSEKYQDLRFATKAREKVVADLEALELVEKIEDRLIEVGHSDRSKTPIEPYLSDQWFLRMGDLPADDAEKIEGLRGGPGLAQLAMDAVCREEHANVEERKACGRVHFFPTRYTNTYMDWLSEKRDWCISRQLWWGHRIPVWTGPAKNYGITRKGFISTYIPQSSRHEINGVEIPTFFYQQDDIDYCAMCVPPGHPEIEEILEGEFGFQQDPDVLDTWFSSALWPHSTMGWPEDTPEMRRYYPGSVLSTAREIITLWVARMVLTGMYNIGKVPFHDVYIHAVIQDGQGRPFKKTLGNGYDPVDIIEVYGADAMRYTMATMTTETQDIRMPMKRVTLDDGRQMQTSERFELGRNFCNKIWNAARFAFMNLQDTPCATLDVKSLPIEDRWILSRVSAAARDVQDALLKFQFSRAVNTARDFFWDSLCDWYLELVKSRIKDHRQAAEAKQVLAFVLDQSLRLLHPFIPFITERLWAILNDLVPQRGLPGIAEIDTDRALILASYPPVQGWAALDAADVDVVFDDLRTATRAVRDIRSKQGVPPRDSVDVTVKVPADRVESLKHEAHVIRQLAGVGELTIDPEASPPKNAATLVVGDMQIYVADVIDADAERARLEKELANLDKQIGGIEGKLANENFTARAPADVVQRERERLKDLQAKRETVTQHIAELG